MGGRAFRVDGDVLTAPTITSRDERSGLCTWSGACASVTRVDEPLRLRLVEEWASDAAFEHASVASFAQFALHLMALGAPPDLLVEAHRAAMDEVEHAQLAYALASAYAGVTLGPGPLRNASAAGGAVDRSRLLRDTIIDACVGESVATQLAYELRTSCREPAARAFYERVASDEERHAALAFRTVAWLVHSGSGDDVQTVASALVELRRDVLADLPSSANGDDPILEAELQTLGRATRATRSRITRSTVREVVIPCLSALIANA